jgi:presenilin-like A22 family membrane protease
MDAAVRTSIIMGIIFGLSQLGAIVMAATFLGTEDQLFEDPNDPLIPLYYIAAVVLFTVAILYIIKKHKENLVKAIFLGAVVYTIFFVLWILLTGLSDGLVALVISVALTAVMTYYLTKRPEWYVVDAAGIVMSIGVIGIFGISLGILPVLVLLIVLAVYDAIAVYGTKHMVSLADGVTQMHLPILLVIPKKRGYSYLEQKPLKQQLDEGEERDAMFMGLGDIIIPGVLVTSAFSFLPETDFGGFTGNFVVSIGTLLGSLLGFALLMRFVLTGNPQAGLPLLNGGAIAGYIVTYLLVFQSLTLGITLPW